jgi:hypothetical protein
VVSNTASRCVAASSFVAGSVGDPAIDSEDGDGGRIHQLRVGVVASSLVRVVQVLEALREPGRDGGRWCGQNAAGASPPGSS